MLVKHENVQPIGAFKVRGGLNLLASMPPAERARGIVGYSTGNHAQSLAYAARHFGVPCTIVMPERPNPAKAAAVRALGAELVEFGRSSTTAAATPRSSPPCWPTASGLPDGGSPSCAPEPT